jgi:hypothetical protein
MKIPVQLQEKLEQGELSSVQLRSHRDLYRLNREHKLLGYFESLDRYLGYDSDSRNTNFRNRSNECKRLSFLPPVSTKQQNNLPSDISKYSLTWTFTNTRAIF